MCSHALAPRRPYRVWHREPRRGHLGRDSRRRGSLPRESSRAETSSAWRGRVPGAGAAFSPIQGLGGEAAEHRSRSSSAEQCVHTSDTQCLLPTGIATPAVYIQRAP